MVSKKKKTRQNKKDDKSRVERKTGVSQMVVFPQTYSPHHEGVMKITTFLSVNNENLGAIARMSNGT